MIKIIGRNKMEFTIEKKEKIGDLYNKLNLSENEYVVIVNGDPATDDDFINPEDNATFLEVFSGG